jgi:hypothetical protein
MQLFQCAVFDCFRVPKRGLGKSFQEEVQESGTILPDLHPESSFNPPVIPLPIVTNPRRFPSPLVYGDPLPPSFDDSYARSLSAHFLVFEREETPFIPIIRTPEFCSGFLSDGVLPSCDVDLTDDESEAPKPLVDDSATESHDEEPHSTTPLQPSKSSSVDVSRLRSHTKVVVLRDVSEDPHLGAAPEPLKGKACVVVSTQGSYQPLYQEFVDPRDIPKLHLFYFDGYSQSPYDVPAVNVDKYLGEKRMLRDRKRAKDAGDAVESVAFCEICKCRIKTTPDEHRASARHQTRVARLDWTGFDASAAAFEAVYGEL